MANAIVGGKSGVRYKARPRALISRLFGFLSLRNAQTIEPTTAWAAVFFLGQATGYTFLHLSGVGRALWANSGEGSI